MLIKGPSAGWMFADTAAWIHLSDILCYHKNRTDTVKKKMGLFFKCLFVFHGLTDSAVQSFLHFLQKQSVSNSLMPLINNLITFYSNSSVYFTKYSGCCIK